MPERTVVDLEDTIVAGDDWAGVFTLTKNGGSTWDITSAVVTADVVDERDPETVLLNNLAAALTTPASGIVTVTLTDNGASDGSHKLHTHRDPRVPVYHLFDFKVVENSGAVTHADLVRVPVTRGITS